MIKTILGFHSLYQFATLTYEDALEHYDKSLKLNLLEQALTTIKENKNYKIKFTKKYWNDYKIQEEVDKCCVADCMYRNIGQGNSQFISRSSVMKICQELKPYDIVLEIEYEDEE